MLRELVPGLTADIRIRACSDPLYIMAHINAYCEPSASGTPSRTSKTVQVLSEKHPSVSGPAQFKPV